MICELCGAKIDSLLIDVFNGNGSDGLCEYPIQEYENNTVAADASPNWTGGDLDEDEQIETIHCPRCGRFPFKHQEVQVYHFVRIVCFKEDAE